MALLPSPRTLWRGVGRVVTAVARRVLRVPLTPPGEEGHTVPDDLPRDQLFAQPLVATAGHDGTEDAGDGRHVVTFRVVVKDADGRRCPDLHVEGTVAGPERTATGSTTTDLLGACRIRMEGPPGEYELTLVDVAGGALDWDRDAGAVVVTVTVS